MDKRIRLLDRRGAVNREEELDQPLDCLLTRRVQLLLFSIQNQQRTNKSRRAGNDGSVVESSLLPIF